MEEQKYTVALALANSRYHIYLRGKEYYLAGKVDLLKNDEQGVSAIVSGTDDYKVTLWFEEGDELHYACSCPVNPDKYGACKHVVATILKVAERNSNRHKKSKIKKWKKSDGYAQKFVDELEQINLDELLESWYGYSEMEEYEGDYFDSMDSGDEDNQLSMWVEEIIELMDKYQSHGDYGEVLKIGGVAVRALIARQRQLTKGMNDLDDWFATSISRIIPLMMKLTSLLKVQHLPVAREEWEQILKTHGLNDYVGLVVPVLGEVLEKSRDYAGLVVHVDKYVRDYPPVALPLLYHFLKVGERNKLIELAQKVLDVKEKTITDQYFDFHNYYDKCDLVVKVRRILAKVYVGPDEKGKRVDNLEKLFLKSKEISDYELLRGEYESIGAKEEFWQKMEKSFGEYGVLNMFEVYKLEGEKERILKLVQKYWECEYLAKMVREIRREYPKECYEAYQKKIDKLLVPTNTAGYDGVAYNLAQMREVGLKERFGDYLGSIKAKYKKRWRMMEALNRKGL